MASLMRRPSVALRLRRSTVRPRNLAVLMGALACMLSGHLALTVAALWLYAFFVLRDVSSPRFAERVAAEPAERQTRLPEVAEVADPGLRIMTSSIHAGYAEVERLLARTPASVRAHAGAALTALQALRPKAARLIREADELSGYLRGAPRRAAQFELQRLEQARERAIDETRLEYERALSVRRDQLAALDQIQRQHDRVSATLERVMGTIEAFPAWIQRLRLLERAAGEDLLGDTDCELQRMTEELSSSQALLESFTASSEASFWLMPTSRCGSRS